MFYSLHCLIFSHSLFCLLRLDHSRLQKHLNIEHSKDKEHELSSLQASQRSMQNTHDIMLHVNPCSVRIELLYYCIPLCCVFSHIFCIWIFIWSLQHDDHTRSSCSIASSGIVKWIILRGSEDSWRSICLWYICLLCECCSDRSLWNDVLFCWRILCLYVEGE